MSDQLGAKIAGANIRRARTNLGLTQTRLAQAVVDAARNDGEHLTLTHGAVVRWEQGTHMPALRYRPYIGVVLGVDSHLLFPLVEEWVAA